MDREQVVESFRRMVQLEQEVLNEREPLDLESGKRKAVLPERLSMLLRATRVLESEAGYFDLWQSCGSAISGLGAQYFGRGEGLWGLDDGTHPGSSRKLRDAVNAFRDALLVAQSEMRVARESEQRRRGETIEWAEDAGREDR